MADQPQGRRPDRNGRRGGKRRVTDPVFVAHPSFFDPDDRVQVKYEMLRRHHVDGLPVVEVAHRFGFSRQGFYLVDAAFQAGRLAGLLPGRPGPKGPRKVTPEMAAFVRSYHRERPAAGFVELADAAAERFGIRVHPRTVRRLLEKKKHPSAAGPSGSAERGFPASGGHDPAGL